MKRTFVVSILLIASICGVILALNAFKANKNRQRRAKYEAMAEGFRRELVAGTTRREVAQYLRSRHVEFHEVSSYYETLSFPCSRWTAYVVFDFHSPNTEEAEKFQWPPSDDDRLDSIRPKSIGTCL